MRENILLVNAGEMGGGKTQFEILLKMLTKYGYDISILSMGNKKNLEIEKNENIKTYRIGKFRKNRRGKIKPMDLLKYFTIEIFNPLLFFFTIYIIIRNRIKTVLISTYNQISLSPLIAARILNRNIIVNIHTFELLCSYSYMMPFCYGVKSGKCGECMLKQHKLPKILERFKFLYNYIASFIIALKLELTNNLADKIVFPSEYSRKFHVSHGVKENTSKAISCFYDCSELENRGVKRSKSNRKKIILYVGRLEQEKGIDVFVNSLIEVSKSNKEWRAIIVGEGRLYKKMKKLVHELKIDKYVTFTGFVPYSKLLDYYHMSDVVVIPSISPETFSIVLTEASLAKKIVIGTRGGALGYRIRDNEDGLLVESNNPNKLAEKIIFVLNNFKNLKHLGENAYIKVKTKYDNDRLFLQYKKIFEVVN
jgi:glycosyltransferase involved in cell wall biosynthesis